MKEDRKRRKVKRLFRDLRYMESDAFADLLHNMALKGWHFKEWKMGLVFEKGESRDVDYAVEVFPKGTEMDVCPSADAEEYAEYCRAAGWELVDGRRRFCIFRKCSEDALPIVTEEERFRNIRKAEWRYMLGAILPLVFLVICWGKIMNEQKPYWVFSGLYIFLVVMIALMVLIRVAQCVALVVWSIRSANRLRQGKKIRYNKTWGNRIWYASGLVAFLCLFYVLNGKGYPDLAWMIGAWIISLAGVLTGLYSYRVSRRENIVLNLVAGLGLGVLLIVMMTGWLLAVGMPEEDDPAAQAGKMPLQQSDYRKIEGEPSYARYEKDKSPFGWMQSGRVAYDMGETKEETRDSDGLEYNVYYSDFTWALETLWDDMTTDEYFNMDANDSVAAQQWGAEQVLTGTKYGRQAYYIRYEDAVLFFSADVMPKGEQIQIVREKLGV